MSKSFDEIMKVLEAEGTVPDAKAKAIIEEHGPITADEKKEIAAAIKMKKALEKPEGSAAPEEDEVTLEDYMAALSTLDSEGASPEEKKKAEEIKAKFEGG